MVNLKQTSTFNLVSGIGTGLVVAFVLQLFNITNYIWLSLDMFKLIILLIIGIYGGQRAVNTILSQFT